jgi:tripartite-type tricarboxylate transporter receptor subunit TctC
MRLAILLFLLQVLAAHAQSWPEGTLRIVVPFAPGSTPDIVARLTAERLAVRLSQSVVVENKAGAGGNIGTDAVAKATPDGRTIGLSIAGPLAVNTLLYKKLPYDPARDLEPVTIAATQASVLVAAAKHPISTVPELQALMRAKPEGLAYSSMGAGSISHLAMEAVAAKSSARLVHVPYAGSGPAVQALLAGDVDVACLPVASVASHVASGKLKALAVSTEKRTAAMPQLPTLAEAGVRGVFADAWMGFVLPAGTPPSIVKRWHQEITAVLAEEQVASRLRAQHMDVVAGTPEQMRAVMNGDRERWKVVVDANRISLE